MMSWPDAYVARFILNKSVNIKQGMDIVSRSNRPMSSDRACDGHRWARQAPQSFLLRVPVSPPGAPHLLPTAWCAANLVRQMKCNENMERTFMTTDELVKGAKELQTCPPPVLARYSRPRKSHTHCVCRVPKASDLCTSKSKVLRQRLFVTRHWISKGEPTDPPGLCVVHW